MEINRRLKPRQSGKSTDIIEMSELLLSIGRKVVILLSSDREVARLRQNNKKLKLNDYNGMLVVGSTTNLDFMRGIRVDCVLVDDFNLVENQSEIITLAMVNNATLYTTET